MVTANESPTNSYDHAYEVEQCQCPKSHIGLSCEDCAKGHKRTGGGNYLGFCEPCECNGHSTDCDADTGVCIVSISFLLFFSFEFE